MGSYIGLSEKSREAISDDGYSHIKLFYYKSVYQYNVQNDSL